MKIVETAAQAIAQIKSNDSVFIQGAMATPLVLLEALKQNCSHLSNVEIMHIHTHGDAFYCDPKYRENFRVTNFFVGANTRKSLDYDHIDYLPCFLSEISNLFNSKAKKVDVALIHISPPNEHGYSSLGTSVDITKAAIQNAKLVIAQINPQMPKVYGDGIIHTSEIDFAFEVNESLHPKESEELSEIDLKIGQNIASIIEDGSTLQMGIGSIPDAALRALRNHKDLGIHTEMFSNEAVTLMKLGVINNSKKNFHRGKSISSFVVGSQELLDYINDNPSISLIGADYVNNPRNIARNPKVVAINSAIEIDLTGQVCADSIGHRIYSGIGGQMDFIRGASLSTGGKPIIALRSTTKNGDSKLVVELQKGAGVVTTRGHIHYVATEYGIVNLYGKTLRERASLLISIAHPSHQEKLEKAWKAIYC